jgi:hypothetical protein
MSIYKRGGIYWCKFMWNGELIRESTKQVMTRRPATLNRHIALHLLMALSESVRRNRLQP